MKILITGGAGRIGSTLRKELAGRYPLCASSTFCLCRTWAPARRRWPATSPTSLSSNAPWRRSTASFTWRASPRGDVRRNAADQHRRHVEHLRGGAAQGRRSGSCSDRATTRSASTRGRSASTPSAPVRPDTRYGLTKVWGEAIGHLFAAKHNVKSLHIRIGSFLPSPQNERASRASGSARAISRSSAASGLSIPMFTPTLSSASRKMRGRGTTIPTRIVSATSRRTTPRIMSTSPCRARRS